MLELLPPAVRAAARVTGVCEKNLVLAAVDGGHIIGCIPWTGMQQQRRWVRNGTLYVCKC